VKRALLAIVVFALIPVSAGAVTPPSKNVLVLSQLGTQWSTYHISAADTSHCPEAAFRAGSGSVRAVFAQRESETILVEKLTITKSPSTALASAVTSATVCHSASTVIDGYTTFPTIKPVKLGHFAVTVRAFSLSATVGAAKVTGAMAFAFKGRTVVALGEISTGPLNVGQFKSDLTKALAKVPS
jgi:hypothetical protein